MDESILFLRLEGPMQSWGARARWDVRDTGSEPTKSGVIGLIGCAMGLRRNDPSLEKLDASLRFGVRIERPGVISTDYQTVTGYHRTAAGEYKHVDGKAKSLARAREHREFTVVSPREYLHDARFLVALAVWPDHCGDDPRLLERISDSLRAPKWPLYLGRKSCVPTCPIVTRSALTSTYTGLETALRQEAWVAREGEDAQPRMLEAWIECLDGDVERQDALRVNPLRNYGFRRCKRIEVDTEQLEERSS